MILQVKNNININTLNTPTKWKKLATLYAITLNELKI
jgi:hypothetical protein